ncbi:hypothetical protein CWI42_091630 [Ordospora colligata]|uniref:Cyclin N-terminal domain-containing protein n=1 Tax=Ordospora colligata OC4 TaxID=1354746 RepID=A0A0B2UJN6_9MICR|nr:uncharacterized protein M896_091650 [Ordospora colligata OC4]KHN69237.1 hypothetical protein M896_091650 [Ordospora colligata OC4]TBU14515.1 hypothetical protein CWI40_091610 [Ordospora colligata]TBU14692.1 hypothetical protein CWI41_091640 [Ordospora colligata]TBU18077.1 hypothetical protein CWI42_091630 [Ordospora colligata]
MDRDCAAHIMNEQANNLIVSTGAMAKFKQLLTSSIHESHVRQKICTSLERSQMSLYIVLTAKHLFDRVQRSIPTHTQAIDHAMLCKVDRYIIDRKTREAEKVLRNEYLVFIGCTIIASKMYMDFSYTNFSWVEVCNHTVDQINFTERQILQILNYDVCLNWIELKMIYDELGCSQITPTKIRKRKGFFKWAFRSLFRLVSCIN